jgi:hypothetical protein
MRASARKIIMATVLLFGLLLVLVGVCGMIVTDFVLEKLGCPESEHEIE